MYPFFLSLLEEKVMQQSDDAPQWHASSKFAAHLSCIAVGAAVRILGSHCCVICKDCATFFSMQGMMTSRYCGLDCLQDVIGGASEGDIVLISEASGKIFFVSRSHTAVESIFVSPIKDKVASIASFSESLHAVAYTSGVIIVVKHLEQEPPQTIVSCDHRRRICQVHCLQFDNEGMTLIVLFCDGGCIASKLSTNESELTFGKWLAIETENCIPNRIVCAVPATLWLKCDASQEVIRIAMPPFEPSTTRFNIPQNCECHIDECGSLTVLPRESSSNRTHTELLAIESGGRGTRIPCIVREYSEHSGDSNLFTGFFCREKLTVAVPLAEELLDAEEAELLALRQRCESSIANLCTGIQSIADEIYKVSVQQSLDSVLAATAEMVRQQAVCAAMYQREMSCCASASIDPSNSVSSAVSLKLQQCFFQLQYLRLLASADRLKTAPRERRASTFFRDAFLSTFGPSIENENPVVLAQRWLPRSSCFDIIATKIGIDAAAPLKAFLELEPSFALALALLYMSPGAPPTAQVDFVLSLGVPSQAIVWAAACRVADNDPSSADKIQLHSLPIVDTALCRSLLESVFLSFCDSGMFNAAFQMQGQICDGELSDRVAVRLMFLNYHKNNKPMLVWMHLASAECSVFHSTALYVLSLFAAKTNDIGVFDTLLLDQHDVDLVTQVLRDNNRKLLISFLALNHRLEDAVRECESYKPTSQQDAHALHTVARYLRSLLADSPERNLPQRKHAEMSPASALLRINIAALPLQAGGVTTQPAPSVAAPAPFARGMLWNSAPRVGN